MITAGMVRGTPAWQDVDAMWEADAAAEWERINAPDPYESQMHNSVCFLEQAASFLDKAEDRLAEVLAEVEDTPMEGTVGSFYDIVSELRCDIQKLAEQYERGER